MNSLERIRAHVAGGTVDRLPVQPLLMQYAARYAGIDYNDYVCDGRRLAEAQLELAEAVGVDCLMTCSDPARELIDICGDESVSWQPTGPAIAEERAALRDPARLATFRVPDPTAPGRMVDRLVAIEAMRAAGGPGVSIVGWVEGPLALAQELRGINAVMMDVYDEPGFTDDLLDFTSRVGRAYWPAQVEAGADTIGMSDAAASMLSPEHYERYIFPAQLRVVEDIRARSPGTIIRLHMCGRTDDLLSVMARLPVDIWELDFPVDLAFARSVLGPDRIILGNVSTVGVMLNGTPDEVYAEAVRCHATSGPRHIVGTGCEVPPETPIENLRALAAYAHEHRP